MHSSQRSRSSRKPEEGVLITFDKLKDQNGNESFKLSQNDNDDMNKVSNGNGNMENGSQQGHTEIKSASINGNRIQVGEKRTFEQRQSSTSTSQLMQQPLDSVEEENHGSMNYRGRAKIYLQNGHKDTVKMNGKGPALFNGNGILEPRSKTLNLGFTECS